MIYRTIDNAIYRTTTAVVTDAETEELTTWGLAMGPPQTETMTTHSHRFWRTAILAQTEPATDTDTDTATATDTNTDTDTATDTLRPQISIAEGIPNDYKR